MAGLAGPPLTGRTGFGSPLISKNHSFNCCHDSPLAHLLNFSPATFPAFKKASRWGAARSSMELGNAASVEVARAAIVPAQAEIQETEIASTSGVTWAQIALQGPRPEMEDAVVVRIDGLSGFTYAAVFDGHAGFASVKFLRDEFFTECAGALQNGLLLKSSDISTTENAITHAFLQADSRLLARLQDMEAERESGSTATVIFMQADRLIVAHVGDSRAVISRGGTAEVVTRDHRPYGNGKTALAEIKRIKEAGGWISNGRICGILSVSRAFGDIKLKTERQEMLDGGVNEGRWTSKFVSRLKVNGDWVTAVPDIHLTHLNDAEFVILASDGLWDSINSSEAVRFVRNQLREHGDVQRACEALASTALDRNTQDNVSVIIADLGKVQRQNGPIEEKNIGSEIGQAVLTIGIVVLGVWLSQFASNWVF